MHKKTLFAAVVLLILAAAGFAVWNDLGKLLPRTAGQKAKRDAIAAGHPEAKAVHVLLLGTDAGNLKGNTDTIMAVSINPERRSISIMSIPRDSRVQIARYGWHKINAANPFGGPRLTVATVEGLLGTWFDYYVLMDFKGAARIIDKLGGVVIDVPKRMDYDDPTQNLHIHLRPGRQHLNGQQAIEFARFRSDAQGDIGRTVRQQQLIQEMARQLLASATLDRLPALLPDLFRSVRTDATLADAVRLAAWFRKDRDWTLQAMTLPGNFLTLNGISYWAVDPSKSRLAWSDLLRGRTRPYLDESLAQREPYIPVSRPKDSRVTDATYAAVYSSVHTEVYGHEETGLGAASGADAPPSQPPDWLFGGDQPGAADTGSAPQSGAGKSGSVTDQTYGRP